MNFVSHPREAQTGRNTSATTTASAEWSGAKDLRVAATRKMPLVSTKARPVPSGQVLFSAQDAHRHLYAVSSGSLKSSVTLSNGRQQVCGFHLPGDLLGLDGMADGLQHSDVIALEDSEVFTVHGNLLDGELRRRLSREIVRGQFHLLLLGQLSAQERLGAFMLDISRRSSACGGSALELHLSMTRCDIGSYLGLTLETVSRTLSHFKHIGLIDVHHRCLLIHDLPAFTTLYRLRQPLARA